MKTPKKPSKEQPLPTQDESRRANVLREEMLSHFRTLGEALSAVREDVASMKPDLRAVKEDVVVLTLAARSHTEAIQALQAGVITLKSDVAEIKGDIKGYNHRLEGVEAKIAS